MEWKCNWINGDLKIFQVSDSDRHPKKIGYYNGWVTDYNYPNKDCRLIISERLYEKNIDCLKVLFIMRQLPGASGGVMVSKLC